MSSVSRDVHGPFQILAMGVLAYKSSLYHSGSYCSRIAGLLGTSREMLWQYRTCMSFVYLSIILVL